MLRALASSRVEAPSPPSRVRDLGLKRALSFIEKNANKPLPVRDVCRAAGVSWRTLDYAFREEFGVTPKSYLKAIQLNGVRRELRRTELAVISDVANRWGFWHMGQFAADYRRLFGSPVGNARRAADRADRRPPEEQCPGGRDAQPGCGPSRLAPDVSRESERGDLGF